MKKLIAHVLTYLLCLSAGYGHSETGPCGISGSIEQRIKDCAVSTTPRTPGWNLITRTKENTEVWLGPEAHIWGETLDSGTMAYKKARSACKGFLFENGGLIGFHFRLPTRSEYEMALNLGITSILKQVTSSEVGYWTSTAVDYDFERWWQYLPQKDTFESSPRDEKGHVRCVARYTPSLIE